VTPNLSALPSSPRATRGPARLLPIATIAAAAILALLPLPVPGYAALTPAFALMAVYHWSVYRPDLLPSSGLFAIGFAQDLVTGATIPAGALVLLLARAAMLRYRRHFVGRPFPFVWAGFAALAAASMLGLWALHCVLQLALFDLRTAIIRGALTVALFPAASLALGRSQRALIGGSA
jgi:rod shape-determining protein MreD